jgi:hypothetical protein
MSASSSYSSNNDPVYIGLISDKRFQVQVVNPKPEVIYTYRYNPYPTDPFNPLSYYIFTYQ